jgi:solute carrier family 25 carnitine/acylcarnitine transporter 20/29
MAEATAASGTSTGLTSSPVEVVAGEKKPATSARRDYKGFVAGVFSGIAKLTGMFTFSVVSCI